MTPSNALVLSQLIEADRRREIDRVALQRETRTRRERPGFGVTLLELLSPIGRLMNRPA